MAKRNVPFKRGDIVEVLPSAAHWGKEWVGTIAIYIGPGELLPYRFRFITSKPSNWEHNFFDQSVNHRVRVIGHAEVPDEAG